jgi:aldehyde:ferredoxin oxidoreductase
MPKGIMGKYLHIDLSTQNFQYGTSPIELFEHFLGGKGAG